MSKEMQFGGNSLVNSDMFSKLMGVAKKLSGGSNGNGGIPRISIKGGKFRKIVNGEQVHVSRDASMNIVIVNSSEIGRTYYAGEYNPENPTPPACWSANGKVSANEVPAETRQAKNCGDCAMNVKGSGNGNARACRYNMQLAVALEGELDTIYKLSLPATSIFGSPEGGNMPMQAYGKFLAGNKTPPAAIVTEMYFDENAEVPKLFFKPLRPLEEAELATIYDLVEAPETIQAITMTVAQADGIQKPKAVEAKPVEVEEPEEVAEPKKVKSKKSAAPAPEENNSDDLAGIIDAWDDE